ncbi:MAG: 2-dehydro-3-deoxygalactonokinase [Sporomusaceae bacterium]|nr:2-dehydro-3-deoxygalactonokinase [Sporomusaceae bacterium]
MRVITIDTGTTNTRVKLWQERRLTAEAFAAVGVASTAVTGSTDSLIQGVKAALTEAAAIAGVSETAIDLVLAAGMITSNLGLLELPHIAAPAGLVELAAAMRPAELPRTFSQPIWFIPGVRSQSGPLTLDNCDQADIMRGEETEVYGLLAQTGLTGPAVVILPGSHTKFVHLDGDGRIMASITSIAGELLAALTRHTLLASSLSKAFAETVEPDYLLAGAAHSSRHGLSRACFQVRLLDLFAGLTVNQRANVLLGAVLADDIAALANSRAIPQALNLPLVIAGGGTIATGLAILLKQAGGCVQQLDQSLLQMASGLGCLAIATQRGLID